MIVSQLKQDVLRGSAGFLVSDVNNGDYCRAEWADRERVRATCSACQTL